MTGWGRPTPAETARRRQLAAMQSQAGLAWPPLKSGDALEVLMEEETVAARADALPSCFRAGIKNVEALKR